MIALWMLYGTALALFLGAAAACADVVFRSARRATRHGWALAMAVSLLLPAASWLRDRTRLHATATSSEPASTRASNDAALAALLARARDGAARASVADARWQTLDRPLMALWLAASLGTLGWLAVSRRRLRRALRSWRPAVVRHESVLVTADVGPAVVGEEGGRIVLPAWALALDEPRLTLMLAHERAHLAARDPQLLTAAAVAVALMPWNPALWWQLRRLRLAVEIDCDRRVLRRHPDVPTYGALLLDVAGRATARHPLPAAALSSATTSLERRIQTMTMRRPRHLAVRTLALGALGTALVVVACETPRPTGLKPENRVDVTSIKSVAPEVPTSGITDARVRAAIREHMPALARGVGRAQMAWIVEDASGKIVTTDFGATSDAAARGDRTKPRSPARNPTWVASINPETIQSIDVIKHAPGGVAPDSTSVVWIRLRAPGNRDVGTPRFRTPSPASRTARTASAAVGDTSIRRLSLRMPAGANAANQPIFIVDGVVVPAGPDGQPVLPAADRIESVEVLKGGAAASIYGDSAAAGVVTITTKKPAAAKP